MIVSYYNFCSPLLLLPPREFLKNCKADFGEEGPKVQKKKRGPRDPYQARREARERVRNQKRNQTRDTSKEAVERMQMLRDAKRAEGKSFYVSMDEIEMATVAEAQAEAEEERIREQAKVSAYDRERQAHMASMRGRAQSSMKC